MTLTWCKNQELLPETASWTLYNFGGYPKCLKWSSPSRPVAKGIPMRLQETSWNKKWATSQLECKSSIKMSILLCVLKVRPRFIGIYKQNCSHTASTWRQMLQGPFTNTVRTPTAEDCLGNHWIVMGFHSTNFKIASSQTFQKATIWGASPHGLLFAGFLARAFFFRMSLLP